MEYDFIGVATASIPVSVADSAANAHEIAERIEELDDKAAFVVFPELSITGYTCADLFFQDTLLKSAEIALEYILEKTKYTNIVALAGMPIARYGKLFNCAVIIQSGKILGVVPKTHIPNYSEYYEKRWFASGKEASGDITVANQSTPFGTDLVFTSEGGDEISFAVEICEDLWAPVPPSCHYSLSGAHVIFNLSASNEVVGKYEYRKKLVEQQSARCICGYVYSSASSGESTTDLVFGGHALIAENGEIIDEGDRFHIGGATLINEIDIGKIKHDRRKNNIFKNNGDDRKVRRVEFSAAKTQLTELHRKINPHPFIPSDKTKRSERCREILDIQTTGLAVRMKKAKINRPVIGISGGLDSTLAFIVSIKACEKLGLDPSNVIAVTMPGFGTTDRTYSNAAKLIGYMGADFREIDISRSCLDHFEKIGHDKDVHDLTYENVQARERTRILMDIAGKEGGLVVGTGDLSELALGWATYNGDHMSMYGVNASVPKTLIRYIIGYFAGTGDEKTRELLEDILDTPVSPELLPPDNGDISQKTENIVGPYELHDFFLYNMVRCGFGPRKILYLAKTAFKNKYGEDEIEKWLGIFIKRFFSQQFKRSCLPDGPKVGSVSLSPRGDWRMPSDASAKSWLDELDSKER